MTSTEWRNWTRDQVCKPAEFVEPRDEEELRAALLRAGQRGLKVRVAGAGHSFNDSVLTDGMLISLARMNRLLDVDASGVATVEAGVDLTTLNEALDACGRAFENLGDIAVQSLAGATATGTHGTGGRFKNISANLDAIEIMTADGPTVTFNRDTPEELRAARVNLGALGVVTKMKVRTVPSFTLHAADRAEPLLDVLDTLEERVASNDHFEFYAFPYSETAWTRTNNRVERAPEPRSRSSEWFRDTFLVNTMYGSVCRTGRRFPGAIPRLNRLSAALSGAPDRIDKSYRIFASRRAVRFTESEYGVPREHAVHVVTETLRCIERERYDVPIPIEVRFVSADDSVLSPSYGRDTCYISAHMFEGMEWEPYFRSFRAIAYEVGGRPHWGKRHPETAESLSPRYPEWDRFRKLRSELDPQGTFENAYVRRVLTGTKPS